MVLIELITLVTTSHVSVILLDDWYWDLVFIMKASGSIPAILLYRVTGKTGGNGSNNGIVVPATVHNWGIFLPSSSPVLVLCLWPSGMSVQTEHLSVCLCNWFSGCLLLSFLIQVQYMLQVSYGNSPKSVESNQRFPQMAAQATADQPRTIMGIKRTFVDNQ